MAVLNKIRQRSVVLIIVIALALFSFVLADVIRNGGLSSQKSQNVIATINGEDIDREEFVRQVEAFKQNMGPQATTSQAVSQVWEMKVRQALLEEQIEELGIRVEEAQLREMMRTEMANNPNFLNEAGLFDEARLREYIATLKNTSPQAYQQWLAFENSIADAAREEIYFNMIKAGVGATLLEGEQAYRFENDNVDLDFVNALYSTVPDSEVPVSKAEIREYIEAHPERFQSEATRDIRYVLFSEAASNADIATVEEEIGALLETNVQYNPVTKENDTLPNFASAEDIETFVNENSDVRYSDRFLFRDDLPEEYADELFNLSEGEVFGPFRIEDSWNISKAVAVEQIPDSVKTRHILVAFGGTPVSQGVTRTKQQAEQLADSLMNVIQNDPAQFAELAAEFSADASNREDGGELGWAGPGMFVPPFNDFIFSNDAGTIGVVETDFGYHVIDIQEQTEPQRAVKLATITRNVEPSETSLNELFTEVTKFELAAKEGDFSAVAEQNDLELRPVMEIQPLEENIPGIGAQRQIVQWAFEEDVEEGEVKRFDVPQGYVVAQVTAVNEEGLKSVEAASTEVIPVLQKEKKAEIIRLKISGETLEEIAASLNAQIETARSVNRNSPVLPGVGPEPYVVGTAFALEEGELSEALAGEKGVFVIKLLAKNEAAELPSYLPYANRETGARRAAINAEVFEALREAAEIEDNRARFY